MLHFNYSSSFYYKQIQQVLLLNIINIHAGKGLPIAYDKKTNERQTTTFILYKQIKTTSNIKE